MGMNMMGMNMMGMNNMMGGFQGMGKGGGKGQ